MICLRCGETGKRRSEFCGACGTALRYPCSNGGGGTSTGMNENTAAVLSYLFGWVTGVIFYAIESNKYVRFHAMQSILAFGSISVLLTFIGFIRSFLWLPLKAGGGSVLYGLLGLFSALLWIAMLILWVILMVKANQGETFKLPIAGDIAERLLGTQ